VYEPIVDEVADALVVERIAVACPHPQRATNTSAAADAETGRFIYAKRYEPFGDIQNSLSPSTGCGGVARGLARELEKE
jgi:hypothetical protein